ncbi:hypothetical protein PHMEG_00023712, partial [Phytophthora megakarya]
MCCLGGRGYAKRALVELPAPSCCRSRTHFQPHQHRVALECVERGGKVHRIRTHQSPPASLQLWVATHSSQVAIGRVQTSEATAYLRDIQWSSRDPMDEATKVVTFMKGLRDGPVKTYLFREYPSTLEAAITLAMLEEVNLKQAKLHTN